jgi:heterodisulfide reductase subunit C
MTETELVSDFKHLYDKVKLCYQCGTCAGGCPVFKQYSKFNPRRVMEKLLAGDFTAELFDDQQIWYCTGCYTCSTRCPQEIDIGHIISEMKNMAVKVKNAPEGIIKEITAILETGITAGKSQSVLKRRDKLGLPEMPIPDMNEIQKLMEVTGVTAKLERLKEDAN